MNGPFTKMARRLHHRLGRFLDGRGGRGFPGLYGDGAAASPFAGEKEAMGAILTGLGHPNPREPLYMLEVFLASGRHLSAEDFVQLLSERGLKIDLGRAGVSLEFFTAMGFAVRHYDECGRALYERGGPGHHDHLICRSCGRSVEFNRPDVDGLIEQIACEEEFCHLQHELVIYGLCPECRRKRTLGLPLSEAAVGESVCVLSLGGDGDLARRLAELGLRRGARLRVLGEQGGAVIVLQDNCRLALGPEMSAAVMVRADGRGQGNCHKSILPFGGRGGGRYGQKS